MPVDFLQHEFAVGLWRMLLDQRKFPRLAGFADELPGLLDADPGVRMSCVGRLMAEQVPKNGGVVATGEQQHDAGQFASTEVFVERIPQDLAGLLDEVSNSVASLLWR